MNVEAAVKGKPFRYERLQLHFIYSFCLSKNGEPLYPRDFDRILKSESETGWTRKLPEDRKKAISPFLALNTARAYKALDFGKAKIESKSVQLSGLLRLFGIGGTLTLTMELARPADRPLEVADTHELLGVLAMAYEDEPEPVDRVSNPGGITPIRCKDRTYQSLFQLFEQTLRAECSSLQRVTDSAIAMFDGDNDRLRKQLGTQAAADRVSEEVGERASQSPRPVTMNQSPWLVTVFVVKDKGPEAEAFCTGIDADHVMTAEQKSQRILPYYHAIGPILFRSVSGKGFPIEPTYRGGEAGLTTRSGTLLSNMHLDGRMFVCSSRRNVVCIATDLDEEPANYFLPGILGINEIVRARWHSLIVLNRSLDGVLNHYGETVDIGDTARKDDDKEVTSRRTNEISLLNEIIRCRSWIGRLLDDPGIYTISGDALAALYDRGKDVFSLDELKDLLIEKANLVDRLHAYEQQLAWRRRG